MQLLLEACRKRGHCPTILFSGTSTQCGMPKKLPVDENVLDDPITAYDFHKLQAERWLKFYTSQGWVKGVSLRLTNVYGPGPKSSSADRGILNLMINKALNGEDLTIYGSGGYIRDYIYIDDVISSFLIAPMSIDNLIGNHFIIGSGVGTKVCEAITSVRDQAIKTLGSKSDIMFIEEPVGLFEIEKRNFIANITRYKNLTGFTIRNNLKHGINKTINSFSGDN
jgi:nucleoside-diphosphate-sugar epimerase